MDAPWSRRSELFASLDDVDGPDLWDEIWRRSQERTRVYVALAAPRRSHVLPVPRAVLALAVAAVLLVGGFIAGRRSGAGAVPQSAAGVAQVDGAAATTVPLVAAASSSGQRCAIFVTFKDPHGMK